MQFFQSLLPAFPHLLYFLFFQPTNAQVGPGVVTGNTAVHDPTMCKDASGKYFVFCEPAKLLVALFLIKMIPD